MREDLDLRVPPGGRGLGELEHDYGLDGGCIAALVLFGAAAAAGGWRLVQHANEFETFLAVVGLAGGPVLAWYVLRIRRVRLTIFKNGLIWQPRAGAPFICRWDEIDALWENLTEVIPTTRLGICIGSSWWEGDITIGKVDGWRVRLSHRDLIDAGWEIDALRSRIRAETQPRLLQEALAAQGEGQTVKFGRVAIGPDGLNDGFGTTPWDEIGSLTFQEQGTSEPVLALRKEGNWLVRTRIRPSDIANRDVFLTVAEARLAEQPNSGPKPAEKLPDPGAFHPVARRKYGSLELTLAFWATIGLDAALRLLWELRLSGLVACIVGAVLGAIIGAVRVGFNAALIGTIVGGTLGAAVWLIGGFIKTRKIGMP